MKQRGQGFGLQISCEMPYVRIETDMYIYIWYRGCCELDYT